MLSRIELCCNDPDNGNFAGAVSAIQVGDLELMSKRWWLTPSGPRLRVEADRFILAGKSWPYERGKEWYGNWCWDAYWVQPEICADFLIWLHGRKLFDVECAEQRVFNLWKRDESLEGSRDFIDRYFSKPSTYSPA
jgi:hypothetical protein